MGEMTKNQQIVKFRKILGENADLVDLDSFVQDGMGYQDNFDTLMNVSPEFAKIVNQNEQENERISHIKELEAEIKQRNNVAQWDMWKYSEKLLTKENLNSVKTIAIYGNIGTGKTSIAYKLLEILSKDKPIFFMKHPRPELIDKLGYYNIRSLEDLERLHDCVIYWDEPQLSVSVYDKKTNSIIAKVCSLARQLNITMIISSSDTRVFTKHNEAFFDLWLIKDVDYEMVKNGSMIKKALKNTALFEPEGFMLEINEYVAESRKLSKFNGKHTFELPKEWNEELSKPYAKIPTETAKDLPNEK